MKKRGISTIVATVLIVLITVAAVTILWAALSPLIGENLGTGTGCFNVQDAVKIDSNQDYTCYNDTGLYVRVQRSANTDTLEGFQLYVTNGGNTLGVSPIEDAETEGLSANGAKTFNYPIADLGVTTWAGEGEVKLSVSPQILVDGENSSCTASPELTLRPCDTP